MSSKELKVAPSQLVKNVSQVMFHPTAAARLSASAKAVTRPVTMGELVPPPTTAIPVDQVVALSKVEHVRFTDPKMALLVSSVRPQVTGLPRASITVPICPTNDASDQMLFEEPSDPSKKRYLPRYRLAEQKVSGQPQYRIALEATAQGDWGFAVHLDKYPAPEIEAASRMAEELQHEVAVILRYRVSLEGAGSVQKELTFQEVTSQPGGLRAVLRINSLAERDQLVQAMTSPDLGPTLIIRRVIQVAILAGLTKPPPGETPPINPRPIPPLEVMVRPRPFTDKIAMMEETLHANVVMMPSPRPMTAKSFSAATMKALSSPAGANVPLYRPVTRVLDHTAEPAPFCFLPTLHGYIFRGLTLPAGDSPGLILHQLRWRDTHYSYYQDAVRRYLFYYLPDAFKIARRPESPHYPLMSVQVLQTDGALDDIQFELAFFAMPFIDQARLKAAAEGLRQHVPEPQVDLEFQPLLADPKQFRLALPRANASSGIFEDRDKALVNLRSGIHDSVTLSMDEFNSVYDALHSGGSAMLFSGEIEVDLPGANERIPFTARITDMLGDIFDYREVADAASGAVSATLRNAIGSPVRITRLGASLRRGTAEVAARLDGLSLEPTATLLPGDEVVLRVVPTAPLAGDGPPDAVFDLDGVEVIPDPEAVWNAILDPTTRTEYARTVKVKTFPHIFEAPADRPNDQIMAIVVDFERGDTIDLSAAKLEAEARLRLPISEYVLPRKDKSEGGEVEPDYRYRLTVIRRVGRSTDQEWRQDRTSMLFPEVN